jgi:L-fucose isomerase-like protein
LSSGYSFALGRILAAVTPLTDADDLEAVERELRNLKSKADLGMQEITRLTSQLDREFAAASALMSLASLAASCSRKESISFCCDLCSSR